MREFTVKEWETRFDELFSLVENGEVIGIVDEDGFHAVFVPFSLYEEATQQLNET